MKKTLNSRMVLNRSSEYHLMAPFKGWIKALDHSKK